MTDAADMSESEAELALAAFARDLVLELAAGQAIEMAAGLVPDPVDADRLRDPFGQFQPPPPGPGSGWHHTLRNPANRGHLLGADDFMAALYGRTPGPGRDAATGAHWGAGTQDSQQEASPAGVLPDSELDARGMYTAARGTTAEGVDVAMQAPAHPAGAPQRPARQRRPRDRYGRRRGR